MLAMAATCVTVPHNGQDRPVHSDAEDSSASPPELIVFEQQDEDESGTDNLIVDQGVASGDLGQVKSPDGSKAELKSESWETIYDQMFTYHSMNVLPSGMDSAQTKQFRERADKYLINNGQLYYKFSAKDKEVKLLMAVRDKKQRTDIIKKCHEDCSKANLHNGRDKTIDSIRQNYYWKGIINEVKCYIKQCSACENRKPTPYQHYSNLFSEYFSSCKKPRLSLESDRASPHTFSVAPAPTSPTTSPTSNHTNGKQFQYLLVKNDASLVESTTTNSSPLQQLAAIATSERTSQPYFIFRAGADVASTNNGTKTHAKNHYSSPQAKHQSPQQQQQQSLNGLSSNGPATALLPNDMMRIPEMAAKTKSQKCDSLWEEVVEGCVLSRSILSTPIVSAMQNGLKFKADPSQMRNSVNHYLSQLLGLPEHYSVILTPSRAVAYLLAVTACMCTVDPMSVHVLKSPRVGTRPLVIVHDASCCQDSTLAPLVAIVGGFCWFLGGPNTPMDRQSLSMAITSNRVAAVVHEPHLQQLPRMNAVATMNLKYLTALCHNSSVSVIVDDKGVSCEKLLSTIKEQVDCGANAIILPSVSALGGPGEACMLVTTHSLFREIAQNFEILQNLVAFPLSLPLHDTLGSLVTLKLCFDEVSND